MSDEDKLIQNSSLFLAIRMKNLTSTQLDSIIEHGGDINAKDANDGNNTPLHVAAKKGVSEIVRLLLAKGANDAEKNSSGQTPLEVAEGSEVVSLLQEHLQEQVPETKLSPDSMQSTPQDSTPVTEPFCYKKRSGTSGIGGQLYETKLLTLILFRALISTDIVEFYLGSNVDGLGALDDVVFWYRTRDDKTRLILIQAKHRDEPKKEGTLTLGGILKEKGDYSLHKYFASYLSIRRKFGSKSENDPIFSEKVDCDYVLYTPARENFECKQSLDPKNASFNTCQDDLLYSTDCGKTFKCHYSLEHVNILAEVASKLRYQSLGSSLADFILSDEKKRENMLLDNLIKTYHVVLVQKVFNISETGQASFKEDFFETTEKSLVILREAMYDKVLENRKQSIRDTDLQNYTNALSNNPSAENISKLLGIVIKYNSQTNTLEVINARDELDDLKNGIKTTAVTPEIIRKATEIEGRSALSSLNVKLPANFGNFDWTVSKNRRMKHIVQKFKELFELATENRVRIDNSMVNSGKIKGKILNSGEVKQDGGLAGMVGNILVRDPSTELLKFNCDENSLQPKAKKLLEMLKTEIGDALEHYRFDITIDGFPQLTLERNAIDEKLAKCFLDNMLFYTNQAKESEIDKILKDEIQVRYKISDPIFCDAVFSMVHDKVVNLWKQQGNVPYLTKNCDYFDKVVAQVRYNPPLTNLSAVCIPQINRFQIKFNTASVDALATQIRSGVTNIISSHVEQCCIKLLQHFRADSPLFITEQYLQVALPYLREMLKFTPDLWKTIIVVGDQKTIGGIEEIITGFEKFQKQLIVLTEEKLFSCGNTINYGGDVFTSLSAESQETLLKEREVFFQRTEIKLNQLVNDKLKGTIDAEMLSLLISKQELCLLKETKSAKNKNIENFLIQRKLKRPVIKIKQDVKDTKSDVWVYSSEDFNSKCNENEKINVHLINSQGIWQKSRGSLEKVRQLADFSQFTVETLDSLDEHVVIVAAEPGMGKSTLMTELVERIKHKNPHSWVVRIDLLLFSDQFEKWNANVIDLPLVLNFLLNVQVSSKKCNLLTVSPDKKVMVDEALRNEISGKLLFEIELFVHNFNQGKIIFIFDGFDEISPNYKEKVINLLKVLQNFNTNKLWVTTRNDNNHLELENGLSTFSYALKPFSKDDELNYLRKRWGSKLEENDVDSTKVDGICRKFIQLLSNSINDKRKSSFMEIPLQLEMIARVFQNEFLEYYKGKPIEKLTIDVVMLYDRFFEIKFEELYEEKAPNINKSDPKMKEMFEKERQSIMKRHEKLALCALLNDKKLKVFLSQDETDALLDDVKSGREKVGLICQIVNGKPVFVHQTYAEFFAARYLWGKFKSKEGTEEFIRDVFLPILRKHEQYQVCCFLKEIALKDFDSNTTFSLMKNKISSFLAKLLAILDKETPFEKNRCARILLKIAVKFMEKDKKYAEEKINSLNQKHRLHLLTCCSEEGYYNLLSCFEGLIDSSTLSENIRECGWSDDPLAAASANGHLEVVNILTKEFYHNANVITWTLFPYLLNLPEINFNIIQFLLENYFLDGSPNGNLFLIELLLHRKAPSDLIKLVANKTDFNLNNRQKYFEFMTIHLLPYDVQLIEYIHSKGADFSQSINSLMLQYCYETMTGESRLIKSDWKLDNSETLFHKIQQFLKFGIGYNRKHAKCDQLSTMQYIKLAYNIQLIISKLCDVTKDRASSVSNFNTAIRKYAKTLESEIYGLQFDYRIAQRMTIFNFYDILDTPGTINSIKRMIKLSEANAGKKDVVQINRILDLQEVQSTQELKRFMDEIRKCNGCSQFLLALLLHINEYYENRDFCETIQEIVTFTNQAPQIYNLWMNMDQQYRNLLEAIQTSNETVRNVLVQIDPDYRRAVINGQDPEYGSPLHYAAAKGDLKLVQTLLEFGADPNSSLDETSPVKRLRIDDYKVDTYKHFTSLHFATMRGYGEVVRVLLEKGAEWDAVTISGRLPVDLAKENGHKDIVKLLSAENTGD